MDVENIKVEIYLKDLVELNNLAQYYRIVSKERDELLNQLKEIKDKANQK